MVLVGAAGHEGFRAWKKRFSGRMIHASMNDLAVRHKHCIILVHALKPAKENSAVKLKGARNSKTD